MLLSQQAGRPDQDLLSLVGDNSRERGLTALTRALAADRDYYPAAQGRYNTTNLSGTHDYGIYVIWKLRVPV